MGQTPPVPSATGSSGSSADADPAPRAHQLLTAGEVADLLGVPKSWVYEQSRTGRIPTVNLGRYRRYRREALEAWIAALEAPARGARAYARGR